MRTWLVTAILLAVMVSPMLTQASVLEESGDNLRYSSPIQATISPSSGWTSGGEEIVITGSGFSDLAFSNSTYDGINHQWAKSTANYADQSGQENSIVVDSNGHVHIVSAAGDNYDFIHSVYDGSSWSVNSIKSCEGSYCWDTHMVIDDNDHLHAAYSTGNNYIIYMNFDGTTWSWSQISSNGKVGPVGIAVDSNNNPHVSYSAYGSYCGNGLMLASFDGVDWTSQTVKSGSNRGCSSALVIEDDDQINIAYQNRDTSKLSFVTGNGVSTWSSDYAVDFGNPSYSMYPGYYSSMAVDNQGQFHIAHYDSKEEDLRYSTGVPNGQWSNTIIDSGGNTGRNPAIAIDAAGDPHIVYHSWAGWDLKYATLNPSSPDWQVSNVETAGSVGDSSSIFIDDAGIIHIAYSDDTNNVLRYATKNSGVSVTNEITVQFGQFGYVTGEVVDDSTIVVTSPVASQADTVTLSLWDKDGIIEHQLSSAFEFISQDDLDNDGVLNTNDDCPNDAGTSTQDLTGCPDDDGDGYSNSGDDFPNDASENSDSDGDGVGDNADALPNDASETLDTDGDGVGDNGDAFPNDAGETTDTDGDGVGDNSDAFPSNAFEQADSDGDGVGDNSDDFPNDAGETTDTDGDGVGDNSDAFPMNAFERFDSDGDGVGDNTDDFPNDASETVDSDGDGVGDNSDAYPNDSSQTTDVDTDGDGVNDVNDLCSNTLENAVVDANGCSAMQLDADGDGVEDTEDDFPLDATQWLDSDGDGYGDNWGDSSWNDSRMSEWTGVFITGASQADYCLDIAGNSTADGYFGCLDADGNGIADLFEQDETNETDTTNETDNTNQTNSTLDSDSDGVPDLEDNCPYTIPGRIVDANGCEIEDSDDDDANTILDGLLSGDNGAVTTTVGIGAILVALLALLQTNAVAAILPDTFRWVQVLRKNSKLTKEERNELTYLQSLVQAYHSNPEELAEELVNLKGDLTARFTNNQIKKETREKLLVLIEELQSSTPNELYQIAHNDAYFGLSEVINTGERTKLLDEKLAMGASEGELNQTEAPSAYSLGELDDKGTYWLEWPEGSGSWYYRYSPEDDWSIYQN